jgi:ribosomal protein S18 acetylase RimI-like enzyme
MDPVGIQPLTDDDRSWACGLWRERWAGVEVVTRGRRHRVEELTGFVAWQTGRRVGLVMTRAAEADVEIVTLDSLIERVGIGSALLEQVVDTARAAGRARVWLTTTNDNLAALRFYQRRGLRIVAVYAGAVDAARALKPTIPSDGRDGIPIHDEIELEVRLATPGGEETV